MSASFAQLLQPSPGRKRVREAARLLQAALDELAEDGREEAAERERRARSAAADERTKAYLRKAEMRRRGNQVSVDRRVLLGIGEDLYELSRAAQKAGEKSYADSLNAMIDRLNEELQRGAVT
jgi:hypothetical protein